MAIRELEPQKRISLRMGEAELDAIDYASKLLGVTRAKIIRNALHREYRRITAFIDDPDEIEAWNVLVRLVDEEYAVRRDWKKKNAQIREWGEPKDKAEARARALRLEQNDIKRKGLGYA